MWGDIPVTRLHIPPRPEAVVSCGRDELNRKDYNPSAVMLTGDSFICIKYLDIPFISIFEGYL